MLAAMGVRQAPLLRDHMRVHAADHSAGRIKAQSFHMALRSTANRLPVIPDTDEHAATESNESEHAASSTAADDVYETGSVTDGHNDASDVSSEGGDHSAAAGVVKYSPEQAAASLNRARSNPIGATAAWTQRTQRLVSYTLPVLTYYAIRPPGNLTRVGWEPKVQLHYTSVSMRSFN